MTSVEEYVSRTQQLVSDDDLRKIASNQAGVHVAASAKMIDGRLCVTIDIRTKGDKPGHPFRGNQWSGGRAEGGGAGKYPVANPEGKDTQQRYKQKDGSYTPERQALHKDIVNSHFEGKEKPSGKPEFLLMGGGPASGKSSVIRSGDVKEPDSAVMIDSDAIKGKIPEYAEGVKKKDAGASAFAHEESSDVSKMVMKKALKEGYNAVLDGTGNSSLEKLKSKTDAARAAGATVKARYLTCDVDEAVRRSDIRAEKTGRKVPHSVIRETHVSVSRVVPKAVEAGLFDDFELWDSDAGKPRLVARAAGSKLDVVDNDLWAAFLKKGE